MKRTLVLVRHGSAEPSAPGGDLERALTQAGGREARHTARALVDGGHCPQKVLCSTARRARDTWQVIREALALTHVQVEFLPRLYLASPSQIREAIAEVDAAHSCLLLVGHNPGLSELTARWADSAQPLLQRAVQQGLSTGSAAVFETLDDWHALGSTGNCHLVALHRAHQT